MVCACCGVGVMIRMVVTFDLRNANIAGLVSFACSADVYHYQRQRCVNWAESPSYCRSPLFGTAPHQLPNVVYYRQLWGEQRGH